MPTQVNVRLSATRGAGGYRISIRAGALEGLPRTIRSLGKPSRLHVVSDATVWKCWGRRLSGILDGVGIPVGRTVIPPGERSKTVRMAVRLWRDIIRAGCDRRSLAVAFGGGVVGDLAGFAAASVLRGIDCIQVPTTLLAMVDSSVGGKTGIDLPEGKNLVGAFHQPRAVAIDLDLLGTLPARQMRSGWAEVVKTAAIRDPDLFRTLEERCGGLVAKEPADLEMAIAACCRIKARVVERDEREGGLRMVLNFGHTLGHAIEAALGYRGILHGEAVARGMAFAARLGEALGVTEPGTAARLERLLDRLGLQVSLGGIRPADLLGSMARDKKRGPRGLRWVLLRRIGRAEVFDGIPWESSRRALEAFGAGRLPRL